MKIAVEGCAHGELENIYNTINEIEENEQIKIDLLICCGDFQSSRNEDDLRCMAVPEKYYNICSFYKYYNGEKQAPILTIFIGGNHEASNYLQELPYGGWVAPNIFYMGYAGVIDIAGVRIGGLSGIYKSRDFFKGRFEKAPYDDNSKRSVYHIRNLDVFRLKQLSDSIDIFLSHDWPNGVYNFGNKKQLLKRKPFFRDDIQRGELGSKPCEELLNHLKPKYWFSAHLHCKFAALIKHDDNKTTRFLALDKCLPKRKFLQIVDVEHDPDKKIEISYDLEWLAILFLTNHLLNIKNVNNFMPGLGGNERFNFTPTEEEKALVLKRFQDSIVVPQNFRKTAVSYQTGNPLKRKKIRQPEAKLNPQTVELCEILGIDDPVTLISEQKGISLDLSIIEDSNASNNDSLITADNTTFISDTDLSMSQSQIDPESLIDSDSVVKEDVSSSANKSLSKINLPEPKNLDSEHLTPLESEAKDDLDSNNCNDESMNSLEQTEKDVDVSQLSEDIQEDMKEKLDEESSMDLNKTIEDNSQIELDFENNGDTHNVSEKENIENIPSTSPIIIDQDGEGSPKRTIDAMLASECKLKDDSKGDNCVRTSENTVSPKEVTSGGEVENSPQPKKFKRRNAEMYKTENN